MFLKLFTKLLNLFMRINTFILDNKINSTTKIKCLGMDETTFEDLASL